MIELTETAKAVLEKRYFITKTNGEKEQWCDLCDRVANAIGTTPDEILDYFNMIYNLEFLPNSPCLMNAGTELGGLSACYVIPVEDDMGSIFKAVRDAALVNKTGGGTGFDFSEIRAANTPVKSTEGVASGPLSFMTVFNEATNVIKQGGRRRGANMGVLRVDHPDILEFIEAKQDETKYTNFNFSVAITDEFMRAVDAENSYNLIEPSTGEIVGKLDARTVFERITELAWLNGEPGCLFIDAVNKANKTPWLGKMTATNPCLTADTPLITSSGIRRLGNIQKGDIIWSKEGWTGVVDKWSTGIKDVYEYETTAGTFKSTDNHKVVQYGEKVEVKDAESIDICDGITLDSVLLNAEIVMDGLIIGDGTKHGREGNKQVLLTIGDGDQDYFDSEVSDLIYEPYSKPNTHKVITSITPDELPETFDRFIPERFINTPSTICSFLRGLFSANGNVTSTSSGNRVCLRATSKKIITTVQYMLSSVGISSYYTTDKAKRIQFDNGTYECRESYKLNITVDIDKFYNLIGFIQDYKTNVLREIVDNRKESVRRKRSYEIKNSVKVSTEEVFDITVNNSSHTFWAYGFDISNCGEQPLYGYESCNLGSINLGKFVEYNNGVAEMNWNRLEKITRQATVFLDQVIDENVYPIPEIKEMTERTRKIGLGIMGLHDMLMKLNIPYDAEEAQIAAEEVMKFIAETAKHESELRGSKCGAYPALKLNSLIYTPIRNAALTSIQPTGTVSMIADCSSGCEPYFSIVTKKTVMDGDEFIMVNKTFEEIAKREGFCSDELMKFLADGNSVMDSGDLMPDVWKPVFKTAQDIEPEYHVGMQISLQKYVDAGISKTINLPNEATVDDVRKIYEQAYFGGCKGVTVYRDGSRTGQVLSTNKTPNQASVSTLGKVDLPDTLDAKRYKLKDADGNSIYIIICFDGDVPMEVFAKFPYDNHIELKDKSTMWTTVCRLVSLCMRCGVPMNEVIKQLDKSSGSMFDLPAQLNKLLKSFMSKVEGGYQEPCPDCGQPLTFKEGCVGCESCGYSKCS